MCGGCDQEEPVSVMQVQKVLTSQHEERRYSLINHCQPIFGLKLVINFDYGTVYISGVPKFVRRV